MLISILIIGVGLATHMLKFFADSGPSSPHIPVNTHQLACATSMHACMRTQLVQVVATSINCMMDCNCNCSAILLDCR